MINDTSDEFTANSTNGEEVKVHVDVAIGPDITHHCGERIYGNYRYCPICGSEIRKKELLLG